MRETSENSKLFTSKLVNIPEVGPEDFYEQRYLLLSFRIL